MLKYMHRAGVHISEESLKAITLPRLSTLSLLYSTWETVTLGRLLCAFPRLTTLYMKRIVFSDEGEQWDSIDPSIRDDLVARLAGLHLKTLTWYCGAVWEELDGLLISSPLCRGLRKLSLPGAYGITVGHKVATAFPILRTAGPSLDTLTLMVSTRDEDEAGLDLLDFSLNTNLSSFHIGILAGGHRSYWADRPASVLRRLVGSPAMYSLRRLDLYLLLYDCTQPPPDNYMRPSNARLGDIIVSMLRDNSHLIITFHARGSAYAAGVARRVLAEYVVRCAPEFVATDAQTRLRLIHDLAVFGSERSPLNMGHWEPGWEDTDISQMEVSLFWTQRSADKLRDVLSM
ncbi:uncharacterized protein B0H18DRAFT_225913 [Fomitopsis serialis]|uniref:uncharacterized protein n=1 Tax=Fomitopsis serialis TaxID=139415 RepID=UPI0020081489|nr:uncharacterized protein B0H18DRAFT_225913 [Neoantrodia serialis]KAH9912938.1 hypothetical protein B0H18DRAFT_225913 [Neoantrodia serialis]